jgi:hypothetical protein
MLKGVLEIYDPNGESEIVRVCILRRGPTKSVGRSGAGKDDNIFKM